MTLRFTVPGAPRGKGRPKFARHGDFVRTYTDDKTAAYENLVAIAAQAAMSGRPPYDFALRMTMTATFAPPKSFSAKRRAQMLEGAVRPAKKPDLDNVLKAVLDGCNRIVFVDDAQVVEFADVRKVYGETPGLTVAFDRAGA